MKRSFKIILFVGILLIGFGALAIYWTFYRPLPDYNTTLELPELHQPVQIYWSPYGVPHIYASNKHDLYMSVGYVHAQDRRWQMNLTQMAAEGRFAEFLGKELLPLDQLQRTIGFWRIAKKMEARLPDSTRNFLEAYAKGVNKYVSNHKKEMPVQFAMAGMEPIPWTVTHSLALARLMAWELNIAWKTELTYSLLLEKMGSSKFRELFPDLAKTTSQPVSSQNDTSGISALALPLLNNFQRYQKVMGTKGRNAGSNAWAVDGNRSNTGQPLIAGDPHLGLNIPGKWYEVHLNLKGRNLSGATLPGAPFVVLGQSDVLAWSLTNVMLDDTDFFEESLHPQDSSQYLLDSLAGEPIYEKFTVQREVIKIKNADDITFTRKLTKHGPVISDIYPEQPEEAKTITMQWTGLQPGRELESLEKMGWAESLSEFSSAVKNFKVPGQNVVYADTAGNIGMFTMADIPIRSGNPIVVRPGWNPAYDWQGSVPYEELPRSINPENGWVANANNAIVSDDYPYYVTVYWQPESRYERIRQYLSSNEQLSMQAFQVMQFDTYSGYARSMTNLILPILKNRADTTFSTALNYLENWDFNYETSETAASIMDVFLLRLSENIFRDEMGDEIYTNFITYNGKPSRILIDIIENGSTFFDDINTPEMENSADIIAQSMQQTLSFLRDTFGDEPSEWRWGNLHTLTLKPPLFGRAAEADDAPATLKLIVNNVLDKGPYPAPGHAMSVNNGEYAWEDPYEMILGASIRRIIDLSDTGQSLSIIPGGQSGNPFSAYYGDQTNNWLNGNYKFFYQDSSRFDDYKIMRFMPKK